MPVATFTAVLHKQGESSSDPMPPEQALCRSTASLVSEWNTARQAGV
jgi:hypothetical protein